jgi:hypothetical protein
VYRTAQLKLRFSKISSEFIRSLYTHEQSPLSIYRFTISCCTGCPTEALNKLEHASTSTGAAYPFQSPEDTFFSLTDSCRSTHLPCLPASISATNKGSAEWCA